MRHLLAVAVLCLTLLVFGVPSGLAQQADSSDSSRKVVVRVTPVYPALARTMSLKGNVRVDAVVSPGGSVRTVYLKGGHPVLAQAAQNAIMKWRWEPASHETREPIEVKFDPQ